MEIFPHAGDISQYGTFDEIQKQLDWLNSKPHKWKVAIAGNHGSSQRGFVEAHPDEELEKTSGKRYRDLQCGNVIYLQNKAVDLEVTTGDDLRRVKIFGSPLTPKFGNFAFQYDINDRSDPCQNLIAPDVEILLTHGPRLEHLDDEQVFGQRVGEGTPASGIYILAVENKALSYNRGQTCYEDIALRQTPWVNLSVMAWRVLF